MVPSNVAKELVLEIESHVDRTLSIFEKINKKRNQLLRAPINSSVNRRNLMRDDEERKGRSLVVIKM